MSVVPFDTYTLNNDNAECWYVLVFDCTLGNFVFKNPCDLLTGCHLDLNDYIDRDTFDWCQIVNSPLITGADVPGNIFRVNMTGTCIEAVPMETLLWWEYKVGCTSTDIPDYLENKIVGTPDKIIVSLIPGINQVLQIDIDPAFDDTIFPENPSCVDAWNTTGYATMTYTTLLWRHRECSQNRDDWYRFQRYLNADYEINSDDPGFPAWGSDPASDSSYRYVPMLW
jgi:hypothetical protein